VRWTCDLLPDDMRGAIEGMITQAMAAMRRTLDALASPGRARRQRALSWEIRTAISFARLQRDQRSVGEARDLLASVYCRFTEGFHTADLRSAKRLLDELT
jgi:predicted ATPase